MTARGVHWRYRRGRPPRGQTLMEYLIVCAALALVLGIGMVDDRSVLRQFLEALRLAYQKFSFALSLPS